MKPLFFGSVDHKLFGIYHLPAAAQRTQRSKAVLLCYPGVHEYNTSHWSFRRLASLLSRQGHHVFRFDYFGTGDSSGEVDEGTPAIWVDDVRTAANELLDISGSRNLSIVGMRLGAALAYRAAAAGLASETLVLWDPVIDGRQYVEQLQRWDRSKNLLFLHATRTRRDHHELLGYRFPEHVRSQLEALDLQAEPQPNQGRIALVLSEAQPAQRALADSLNRAGISTSLRVVSGAADASAAQSEKALLSNEILVAIAEALDGRPASVPRAGT